MLPIPAEIQIAILFGLALFGLVIAAIVVAAVAIVRGRRQPCSADRWVISEIDNRITRQRQRQLVDELVAEIAAESPPQDDDE